MEKERLFECTDLHTSFFMEGDREVKAVNGVSYYIDKGEVVAVVGESGCGKSVTQMSVMQLIKAPGKVLSGNVTFNGAPLMQDGKHVADMNKIRGNQIAMIFQEPMTSLNPVFTVGEQIVDIIRQHKKLSKREAWKLGESSLAAVGIPDAPARMKNYPFEMSGGMRQRVLIAFAVALESELIIADEPTTALDVTVQAQVMELLMDIKRRNNSSIIVVTHNLGLVSRYADRIYVMYAGRIIESGTKEQILTDPKHPYTKGLLAAVPKLENKKRDALVPIDGAPPSLVDLPDRCAFYPRCTFADATCEKQGYPCLRPVGKNHYAACHLAAEEE